MGTWREGRAWEAIVEGGAVAEGKYGGPFRGQEEGDNHCRGF